jgi:hemoglobin
MKFRMLVAAFLLCGTVRADEPAKPLDRAELDKRAGKVAHDTAKLGSELWTAGEIEGCFRLYHGALLALQPMLDHRPKLAALVKEKLDDVKGMRAEKGAFVLREALDAIQKDTLAVAGEKKGSLWSRLGGEKTVKSVIHDFVDAAIKDPKVNFTRNGTYKLDAKKRADLEERLVELISEVGKGPLEYTGRDVKKLHAGMKITEGEFDALVACLDGALKKNKVPEADAAELVKLVNSIKSYFTGQ